MPLTPGQRLASYEIISSLGTGGMGEVYRARDSKLGREVALKVLPPDVIQEAGRLERFDREARAIAALNHPHIVTIFSTEEAGGVRFLTMELVEGHTLTDLVISTGMTVTRFLDIAIPLADALAAAHQKQITHRDLKPGNVMVSNDGRVKVLDFGLARVGSSDHGEQTLIETLAPITHQGMIVGTMPYMSPEQVEGRPIDARSDLFSLGVIFYELLSGGRPFKGASSPALMSAILRDTPPPLADSRTDVPEAIERLITRLIEKRPEDRVQTARDVFNELKHVRKQMESGSPRSSSTSRLPRPAASANARVSVSVRSFAARGTDDESKALAEALSDDIRSGLAKFGNLKVLTGSQDARYLVEGQVRRAGNVIRVGSSLTDTQTAEHLWAQQFDRDLAAGVFSLQDDLSSSIVATIGDPTGVLTRSIAAAADRPYDQLSVLELIARYHAYTERFRAEEHLRLRDAFEAALEREALPAEGWAALSMLYWQEHTSKYNPLPDAPARQRRAAERAVEIDPHNQQAWLAMASAHRYSRDQASVRAAVDRAIRVNPLNADGLAHGGLHLAGAGDYDRALELTRRAIELKPHHPGWYHLTLFCAHFARGEYAGALREAKQISNSQIAVAAVAAAAASGLLDQPADARPAIDAIRLNAPALLDPAAAREAWSMRLLDENLLDRIEEGYRRAIETVGSTDVSRPSSVSRPPSSASGPRLRTNELSVAILPFTARSSDDHAVTLADALPGEITTGLSRFGYVRVVTGDNAAAARYALSGVVRTSGQSIRVSVQLRDARGGATLWAENFDGKAGEDLFALQDSIASRVVATVGDESGVLMRSMASAIADVPIDQLSVHELVVRYFAYAEDFRPDEHAELRTAFERALEKEPRVAEGWACLAMLCEHEHGFGYNPLPNTVQRHRQAAERAIALDARSPHAWSAMVTVHLFAQDLPGVRAAVERVVSLNPLNADLIARSALFLDLAGDHDRALELTSEAMALKPQHPASYHFVPFNAAYARGDDALALKEAKLLWMPKLPVAQMSAAAAAGQLGLVAEARVAVEGLRQISPELVSAEAARRIWSVWMWDEPFIDRLVDGFAKALVLAAGRAPVEKPSSSTSGAPRSGLAAEGSSIAVLPFSDLSEKKDQDWFCDGIAEEIMSSLAPLPGLRVAARASAFSFRGKADDLAMIAEKLHVDTVLEGSVRRAGDRVRITTQLSDAKLGKVLWSERFDRELKDIFDVQEEIARAIVDRLRVAVSGGVQRIVTRATANLEAYELLLKGRMYLSRRGPAIAIAIESFEKAIAIDPNLADAHAGLGDAYRLLGVYGLLPSHAAMQRSRQSLERALAIEPDQVEALATLANIKSAFEWRPEEAMALSDRAIALDPGHVRALMESAVTLAVTKKEPSSDALNNLILERMRRARALDPLGAWTMSISAMVLTIMNRDEEAADLAVKALATDPNNFTAHWARTFTLAKLKRRTEAKAAAEAALPMSKRHPTLLGELAALHALDGDREGAAAIYQELVERSSASYVGPASLANAAMAAGAKHEARRYLSQALADHDAGITFYKLPAFELLWNDPECAELFERSELFANRPS